MSLSFGEIVVAGVVAVLLAKPQDIKYLLKQIYSVKLSLQHAYKKIFSDLGLKEDDTLWVSLSEFNIDEINFYLKKIAELGGKYEGGYDLNLIKKKYFDLIKHIHKQS